MVVCVFLDIVWELKWGVPFFKTGELFKAIWLITWDRCIDTHLQVTQPFLTFWPLLRVFLDFMPSASFDIIRFCVKPGNPISALI